MVSGNTETGISVTYQNGKLNFVVTSAQAPSTHTRYLAAGTDNTFVAGDFATSAGATMSTTDTINFPVFTADSFIAFAQPNSQPAPNYFRTSPGGRNEWSSMVMQSGSLTINNVQYNWWVSDSEWLVATSGITVYIGRE